MRPRPAAAPLAERRSSPVRTRAVLVASTMAGFVAVLALHASASPTQLVVSTVPPGRSPATTTTGPASSRSTGVRSATGSVEQYGYGALSVRVTVDGTRITDIAVASLQTAESYSQSIAAQAIPTLRNEVLSAQSTNVSGVSGATYTTQAYLTSLQSALDALHV